METSNLPVSILIGESYTNFLKILTDLDILKNLYSFEKNDACLGYDLLSPYHNTIGSVIISQ